jgi:hypothetical protein
MRLFFCKNGTSIFDDSVDSVVLMALFRDRNRRDTSDIDKV